MVKTNVHINQQMKKKYRLLSLVWPLVWPYYMGDALGSVRQLIDSSGNVVLTKDYEPYGEVMNSAGTTNTAYGFTGEWTDSTGMVYLRARYYDPTMSRFMTRDTWGGDRDQPMTYNEWLYVLANPINYTDPFGFTPIEYPISLQNDRDLTLWLFRELSINVDSFYVQRIKTLLGGSIKNKYDAINGWMWLVKDSAKWDFKHRIDREIGRAITFIDYQQGFRWYEYSVPGNIFYGYIGTAAGFSELMLHGGASYAEIIDPSHQQQGESCCPYVCSGLYFNIGPFSVGISIYCKLLGCYYINPSWAATYFDDPTDYSAIDLGIELYKSYQNGLTFTQLIRSINSRADKLAHPSYTPSSFYWINPLGGWPYDIGRFNGPNDSSNEPIVLRYLK
jgi:RHS repeat-associated protein